MTERASRPPLAFSALVIVGIVGWIGLIWIGASLYGQTPPRAGFDLELLIQAGRDVASGRSPYDPALVAGAAPVAESLFYSYPPIVAQAMALVSPLPSPVVFVAWTVAAVAGLAAIASSLARRLTPQRSAGSVVVPVVALAPLCFPFAIGLLFGNLDVFFPVLYGAMLLAVMPQTDAIDGPATRSAVSAARTGGAALALASLAKLHPASLGAWFGGRAVGGDRAAARVVVVAIVVAATAVAASLAIGGVTPWMEYVGVVRAGSNADLIDPRNAGPAVQLALLLGRDDGFARTAQIGVTLAVLGGTLLAARRGGDPVERLGWAAAASLATLPVTWFHYPSALLPFGVAALLRADGRKGVARRVRGLVAASLVVAAVAIAALPLLWLAIGLALLAVRASRPTEPPE